MSTYLPQINFRCRLATVALSACPTLPNIQKNFVASLDVDNPSMLTKMANRAHTVLCGTASKCFGKNSIHERMPTDFFQQRGGDIWFGVALYHVFSAAAERYRLLL